MRKVILGLSLAAVLSLTACSNKTNNGANNNAGQEATETIDYAAQLAEIKTAVEGAYDEEYSFPGMEIDAATLDSVYGIKEDMYDAVVAVGPAMSVHVDTFIGIHPTEGNKQAVIDALNAYRDNQITGALQYPMNLMKIQASEVIEKGDYVFFLMLGYTDEMFEDEAAELAAYQAENQKAVDAIDSVIAK